MIAGMGAEIFIITGPMAAGKTQVAAGLARSFERGVHLEGDVFRRFILTGRYEMRPQMDERALAQLRLRYELSAMVAQTYASHGFTVVLEDVIGGPLLEDFVSLIIWRPLRLTVLLPNPEVIAQREAARGSTGYREWTPTMQHRLFVDETPRLGYWLDTSEQSLEETVNVIRSRPSQTLIA